MLFSASSACSSAASWSRCVAPWRALRGGLGRLHLLLGLAYTSLAASETRLAAGGLGDLRRPRRLVDLLDHEAVLVLAHAHVGQGLGLGQADLVDHREPLGHVAEVALLLLPHRLEGRAVLLVDAEDALADVEELHQAVLPEHAVRRPLEGRCVGLLVQLLDAVLVAGDLLRLALDPVGGAAQDDGEDDDAQDQRPRRIRSRSSHRWSRENLQFVSADDVRGRRRGGQGDEGAEARYDGRLHGGSRAARRSGTWNRHGMTD